MAICGLTLAFTSCNQSGPGATFDRQAGRCVAVEGSAPSDELEACERGATGVRAALEVVADVQADAFSRDGGYLTQFDEGGPRRELYAVSFPEGISMSWSTR